MRATMEEVLFSSSDLVILVLNYGAIYWVTIVLIRFDLYPMISNDSGACLLMFVGRETIAITMIYHIRRSLFHGVDITRYKNTGFHKSRYPKWMI